MGKSRFLYVKIKNFLMKHLICICSCPQELIQSLILLSIFEKYSIANKKKLGTWYSHLNINCLTSIEIIAWMVLPHFIDILYDFLLKGLYLFRTKRKLTVKAYHTYIRFAFVNRFKIQRVKLLLSYSLVYSFMG